MKEVIKQFAHDSEYYILEGCYINELSNTTDDPEMSIAQARVKPGVTTQWHRLKETTERYVILEGKGWVEIGGLAPCNVTVGDVVIIPPLCRQRITNKEQIDLVFLAICTPRFKSDVYERI